MKKHISVATLAVALTALAFGVSFVLIPRSEATQGKRTPRKGPHALAPLRSEVPGVELSNARFQSGSTSLIYFDVINHTAKPVAQISVVADEYTLSTDFDDPVQPGETRERYIETDMVTDNGEIVLAAAYFTDGTSVGRKKQKAMLKKYRDEAAERAAHGKSN